MAAVPDEFCDFRIFAMAYGVLIVAVAVNGFGSVRLPLKKPKIPVLTRVVVLNCALILTYWPGG